SLTPEVDEATFRRELGAAAGARLLGLLPGSRAQEVRAHLPTMLAAARRLRERRPDLVPVVALAGGADRRTLARAGVAASPPGAAAVPPGAGEAVIGPAGSTWEGVRLVRGRARAVERWAVACAVASGTATLETALFATPLVIVYRMGRINWEIARRVVTLSR